jgi:hypothetical protein
MVKDREANDTALCERMLREVREAYAPSSSEINQPVGEDEAQVGDDSNDHGTSGVRDEIEETVATEAVLAQDELTKEKYHS